MGRWGEWDGGLRRGVMGGVVLKIIARHSAAAPGWGRGVAWS